MKWTVVRVVSFLLIVACRQPKGISVDRSGISTEDANLRSVFDQIVSMVLASPDLKDSREFYGTADDTRCALVSNEHYGIPWPTWYTPEMNGIRFLRANEGTSVEPSNRRLLGIRIDKLELDDKDGTEENDFSFFDGPIHVTLLNVGGDPEGVIVTGGSNVYFRIEWESQKPKVVYTGWRDA